MFIELALAFTVIFLGIIAYRVDKLVRVILINNATIRNSAIDLGSTLNRMNDWLESVVQDVEEALGAAHRIEDHAKWIARDLETCAATLTSRLEKIESGVSDVEFSIKTGCSDIKNAIIDLIAMLEPPTERASRVADAIRRFERPPEPTT